MSDHTGLVVGVIRAGKTGFIGWAGGTFVSHIRQHMQLDMRMQWVSLAHRVTACGSDDVLNILSNTS